MVFDLFFFFLRNSEVCNALFNQISTVVNALLNVANALGNIANAFENNCRALESISNGLKNVVTHFQCIFQRIFNAFSTYLL